MLANADISYSLFNGGTPIVTQCHRLSGEAHPTLVVGDNIDDFLSVILIATTKKTTITMSLMNRLIEEFWERWIVYIFLSMMNWSGDEKKADTQGICNPSIC